MNKDGNAYMVSFHLMGLHQKLWALRKRGRLVCPIGESRAVIICGSCCATGGIAQNKGNPINAAQVAAAFEANGWRMTSGGEWRCPTCAAAW